MRTLLTGGGGMLAASIARAWADRRPHDPLEVVRRSDVDLRDAAATQAAVKEARPDLIIHAAAYVGGIGDKLSRPLPYLVENLRIDSSVVDAAVAVGVPRFVYIASAAAYPAAARNPITEEALFTGPLEPANEGYGLAKLTGLTAVRYAAIQTGHAFRSIAPSNLYGPQDSFDPARAHLIASTLRKAHKAKADRADRIDVWGDGTARREFTYAPDVAGWLVSAVDTMTEWPDVMNVGAGEDRTVREYYELAAEIVGFDGGLRFDPAKPSGVARRLIDSRRARAFGWSATTDIRDGMAECYRAFLSRLQNGEPL